MRAYLSRYDATSAIEPILRLRWTWGYTARANHCLGAGFPFGFLERGGEERRGEERTRLEQAMFERKESSRVARGNMQFRIDGAYVGVHGTPTDNERFGHLRIGQTSRYQPQHLNFARSQARCSGGRRRLVTNIAANIAAARTPDWRCRGLTRERGPHRRERLLQRHGISLGPCASERLLATLGKHDQTSAFYEGSLIWGERHVRHCAQRLGGAP